MATWQASIVYGPEVEWGTPEDAFEVLLRERGITDSGVDAGTDLHTGQRDFTWYFEATSEQAREIEIAAPAWRISEYQDEV